MAGKVITREWVSRGALGRKVRHTAYGYDVTINGVRERKFSTEWLTANDALGNFLSARGTPKRGGRRALTGH
jgi:hypothetical protein